MANGGTWVGKGAAWVGNSVTEVNVSTGALLKVISGPAYQFNGPHALAVIGDNLFVANKWGNSVTEVNASTGALVKVMSASGYRFGGPEAMAVAETHLFVANYGGSVTDNVPGLSQTGCTCGDRDLDPSLAKSRHLVGQPVVCLRPVGNSD